MITVGQPSVFLDGSTNDVPVAFLDVGTGVGWRAIEAARSWPALRVVAVDPWEPALTLARQNLAQSGVAERVELRSQRVEQFEEATTFTVAWLPGPFIAREIADRALERVYCAIVPGGWLVFGFNPPPHGRLEEALASLRVVRSGGYPWTPREVEEKLQEHVSSKSKCTRPRRQFRLSLPHPSARSCLWSGDGQCHLKISAAAPRMNSDRKRRDQ